MPAMASDSTSTVITSWPPARLASSFFCAPRYWAHTIVPPVAMAENTWIISTLMASTSETAEMAADPALLTIMVSTEPIMAVSTCSAISGISRLQICFLVNIPVHPRFRQISTIVHYTPPRAFLQYPFPLPFAQISGLRVPFWLKAWYTES